MLNSEDTVSETATAIDAAEAPVPSQPVANKTTSLRSIGMVVTCTLLNAASQLLLKDGSADLGQGGIVERISAILGNWPLFAGYACLGLSTVLLVLALREGQLSILYPIIALSYVWVAILSPMLFDDAINTYKAIGICIIVLGVSLIGLGSRSE